ncbi:hypothetical protein AV521_05935 [Streptomyces sp. IMTB 2501]|uniref:hypothetical protein n=1 Tax=Streptomyces sp. IMTB 2501 TaxID=1776340 RepID=UPI00096DDE94|nr:hypothetical protein [Streptomyces sp. IMTB 2501]OLZ73590.1 hypothetical protein AV521_05935 [Streptomyces sp. IMTB 2501]
MKDSYELYRHAVRDVWRTWWVSWPLSRRVEPGQVLESADGQLRTAGSLAGRAVPFASRPGTPHNDYTYDTQGSASVTFKAAGTAADGFTSLATGDVGARVGFERGDCALVVYRGLTETGVEDTRALTAALVRRGWADWDENLLAVTDVVGARSGLVLTAADGASEAELRFQAGALSAQPALADLSAATAVAWRRHIGLEWLATDVTPFYRVVRLRKGWFGRVKKDYGPRRPGRGAADVPVPPVLLEEAQDDPAAVLEQVPPDEQPLPGEAAR